MMKRGIAVIESGELHKKIKTRFLCEKKKKKHVCSNDAVMNGRCTSVRHTLQIAGEELR